MSCAIECQIFDLTFGQFQERKSFFLIIKFIMIFHVSDSHNPDITFGLFHFDTLK